MPNILVIVLIIGFSLPLIANEEAQSCGTSLEQHNEAIPLLGNRKLQTTSWMPPAIYEKNKQRIKDLVKWADAGMCSQQPLSTPCPGLLGSGHGGSHDVIVVTPTMLLWFDNTPGANPDAKENTPPNGGGGMLRGAWPLTVDKTGNLNFCDIRNEHNWAPNRFLPGASGAQPIQQGSGFSSFIASNDKDDGVTYNVENDPKGGTVRVEPAVLAEGGAGKLHREKFIVQTRGHFVDTRPGSRQGPIGNSPYQGKVEALHTYRISPCARKVEVEAFWKNESDNPVGPVANAVMAINILGSGTGSSGNGVAFGVRKIEEKTGAGVVRRRHADTKPGELVPGHEYGWVPGQPGTEYRAPASLTNPPPDFKILEKGRGQETRLTSNSGIVSTGVIFDTHSEKGKMISAFDISLFNQEFWESADPRAKVPTPDVLPEGIMKIGKQYYLKPKSTQKAKLEIDFHSGKDCP